MTEEEALKVLTKMRSQSFSKFLRSLPPSVEILVRSGMVDWKKVLPAWYIKIKHGVELV